jgi:TonB family protein
MTGQSHPEAVNGAVAQRVMPDVGVSAMRTIRGTVNVRVRVNVSPTGEVVDAGFDSAGPSKYFARISMEAARKWKFTPAQANGRPIASAWILRFAFTREKTDVTPEQIDP